MAQPECVGILGRIFGHQFIKRNWENLPGHCLRCGYRPGGRS